MKLFINLSKKVVLTKKQNGTPETYKKAHILLIISTLKRSICVPYYYYSLFMYLVFNLLQHFQRSAKRNENVPFGGTCNKLIFSNLIHQRNAIWNV